MSVASGQARDKIIESLVGRMGDLALTLLGLSEVKILLRLNILLPMGGRYTRYSYSKVAGSSWGDGSEDLPPNVTSQNEIIGALFEKL
jgi:hypothetical protein